MSRRPPKPLTVRIELPADAPKTEADWTPAQEQAAITALATLLSLLSDAPATGTTEPERGAA